MSAVPKPSKAKDELLRFMKGTREAVFPFSEPREQPEKTLEMDVCTVSVNRLCAHLYFNIRCRKVIIPASSRTVNAQGTKRNNVRRVWPCVHVREDNNLKR